MKTLYYTASSLDGYIADPEHSLEWLFQFSAGPLDDYPAFIAGVGAVAMGSSTYEWLLRHQIFPEGGDPQPWPYSQPSWVFTSRKLREVPGANVRFVQGDVRPVHREMVEAAAGKNIWIVGGGDLVGQFHDHGLLDEITVDFASVTLGAGAPVLPRRIVTPPLRLTAVRSYGTAFARLVYEVPKREA